MINVGPIQRIDKDSAIQVSCDFEVDGKIRQLWFQVSSDYSKYLEDNCGDAFFTILSLYAQLHNEDITFESPVSKRLFLGVKEVLLPALNVVYPGGKKIQLVADTKDFDFHPSAHGTALSLGVDSFHSLASNLDGPYPISHVTLFNAGAYGETGGIESRDLFANSVETVENVAKEIGLPLVVVDSNISEVLETSFLLTHSVRNLACALLLPHLFKFYSYASGYPVNEFQLKKGVGIAHYDLLVSKALSTDSLEVMISGLHSKRIDKIQEIASYEPARRHLNVCLLIESNPFLAHESGGIRNCSRCYKCVKTLAAIDALGLLEEFSEVFDLETYGKHKYENLGNLYYASKRMKDKHATEIFQSDKGAIHLAQPLLYWFVFRRALRAGRSKVNNLIERCRK